MDIALKNAYKEVSIILDLLGEEYKLKIPKPLLKLFNENQNINYCPNINIDISREALTIISILNLKYWETNDKEIKRLKEIYSQNQIDYQKKMGLYNVKKPF